MNYSNLLEMSSRAQLKLILVIQNNPTLLENIDESLIVDGDDMMSLYKRLEEVQNTIITELKDITSSVNDNVKDLSTYTAVGKVPNTEDDHMSMFTRVFNNLQSLAPKWKTLQGRGQKSLKICVQGQTAAINTQITSLKSRLDSTVSRANTIKRGLEIVKNEKNGDELCTKVEGLTLMIKQLNSERNHNEEMRVAMTYLTADRDKKIETLKDCLECLVCLETVKPAIQVPFSM